jgi:hypothetical protein
MLRGSSNKRFGGGQIDYEIEVGWLLDRQIGRFAPCRILSTYLAARRCLSLANLQHGIWAACVGKIANVRRLRRHALANWCCRSVGWSHATNNVVEEMQVIGRNRSLDLGAG